MTTNAERRQAFDALVSVLTQTKFNGLTLTNAGQLLHQLQVVSRLGWFEGDGTTAYRPPVLNIPRKPE